MNIGIDIDGILTDIHSLILNMHQRFDMRIN